MCGEGEGREEGGCRDCVSVEIVPRRGEKLHEEILLSG